MKSIHRLAVLAAALAVTALAVAQDTPHGKGGQTEAGAGAGMPMPTPSPELKKLSFLLGQFTSEEEFFPHPMNPEAMKSKGSFTARMSLGDFFVRSEVKSNLMGGFEGLSLLGYDAEKKQYVSHWFDSFGTTIEYTNGQWKDDKTLLFECDIVMHGAPMRVRVAYVIQSATAWTLEEHADFKDGKGFIPTMKIRFTKSAN